MTKKYYNKDKQVTKEAFNKERAYIISKRIEEAKNNTTLIKDKDLDYYLDELQKLNV